MTEIERLTALWVRLIDNIDRNGGKWFVWDAESSDWQPLAAHHLHDVLYDLGVGGPVEFEPNVDEEGRVIGQRLVEDPERKQVILQFIWRDSETHRRPTSDIKRAQLRFKL